MKSLEELEQLRNKAKAKMLIRLNDEYKYKVEVVMGTTGIKAGAKDVMHKFMEEVEKQGANAIVSQKSNKLFPGNPVTVRVVEGDVKTLYENINLENVSEIVASHLINGTTVSKYVVKEANG